MKYLLLLFALSSYVNVFSQIGIGTDTPDASAELEVSSINRGFLPPRVLLLSKTDTITISKPATGLLVYNSGTYVTAGYYYFNGTGWVLISAVSSLNDLLDAKSGGNNFTNSMLLGSKGSSLISSAFYNTGLGINVLPKLTSGQNNTAVGYSALSFSTTGMDNSAFGSGALFHSLGGLNNAFGSSALLTNTTGSANNAFGTSALYANSTGLGNQAFGYQSLYANNFGYFNAAIGEEAMMYNTDGFENNALGTRSLYSNHSGKFNLACGNYALYYNSANFNTGLGDHALYSNLTGYHNTAVGKNALKNNVAGNYNTAIGDSANVGGGTYGDLSNSTAIGANALVTTSNTIQLGASTVTAVNTRGAVSALAFYTSSDIRLKTNIRNIENGLSTVLQLHPYSYEKKATTSSKDFNTSEFGFLAQELQTLLPQVVGELGDTDKTLTVNYIALIPILTKAIQEQQLRIADLEKKIKQLAAGSQNTKKTK